MKHKKTVVLLAAVALLCLAGTPTSPQGGPRWANVSAAPVGIESIRGVTANGRILTVLFDSLRVSLQDGTDSMSTTRIAAFKVDVEGITSPAWLRLTQQVRGHVTKDENARVVIVLDMGQIVQVREYPYGRRLDGPIVRSLPGTVRFLPNQRYSGRIIVFAERRTPDANVLVDIDSLDAVLAR